MRFETFRLWAASGLLSIQLALTGCPQETIPADTLSTTDESDATGTGPDDLPNDSEDSEGDGDGEPSGDGDGDGDPGDGDGDSESACGNSIVDPGEACDDGNQTDGDGCDSECQFESCGDGILQEPEECDDGFMTINCDENCTLPECGDGTLNAFAGEKCDDGNVDDSDGCSPTCQEEYCADSVVQEGEACDAGGLNGQYHLACDDPNSCALDCQGSGPCCGDKNLDNGQMGGEACDEGELNSPDYDSPCLPDCSGPGPHCGDDVTNGPEFCDADPGCNDSCTDLDACVDPNWTCDSCEGCAQHHCWEEYWECTQQWEINIECACFAACLLGDDGDEIFCSQACPGGQELFQPLKACMQGLSCQEYCGTDPAGG